MITKKAVVLFSGGLDSTTVLKWVLAQGYACYALSFSYGQRHEVELTAARKIAADNHVHRHCVFPLELQYFGGSALTDAAIPVPNHSDSTEIPVTYVPARNTVFLSIALAWAESLMARDIFIGVSAIDYSHYADCRPAYLNAFQAMADLATKTGVEGDPIKIHAPLLYLSKAETIKLGSKLGVDYSQTVSCYQANPAGEACGECDSCYLRKKGFADAEIPDPTHYRQSIESTLTNL